MRRSRAQSVSQCTHTSNVVNETLLKYTKRQKGFHIAWTSPYLEEISLVQEVADVVDDLRSDLEYPPRLLVGYEIKIALSVPRLAGKKGVCGTEGGVYTTATVWVPKQEMQKKKTPNAIKCDNE